MLLSKLYLHASSHVHCYFVGLICALCHDSFTCSIFTANAEKHVYDVQFLKLYYGTMRIEYFMEIFKKGYCISTK